MSEKDEFEAWWQRGEWNVAAKDLAWKDMCRMAFNAGRDPQAELDALRADAERYRWLRENQGAYLNGHDFWKYGEHLDAAIDAAIAATGAQS